MPSFNKYKHVFTPIKVGTTTLKSRVEFSPMVCDMVTSLGEPLDGYIDYIESQAETGVGLIHIGATPINWETAPDHPAEIDITDDRKVGGLFRMAEAAHRHGAKLSVEIMHAGRGADPMACSSDTMISSSVFTIPNRGKYVREMDLHDIEEIVAQFADCAARVKRCGFDGCLIHGAHGNLLAQFLSPRFNKRNDMFGGSLENRARFPLQVIQAVREAVGKDFIVELRISGSERMEGGMEIDEVIEFIKMAQPYLDLVTISAGQIVDLPASFWTMPPYYHPKGANVPLAREVKQCPDINIPVSVVGGIISAEMADQIIEEGSADMVAMARALIADPDMLNKSYRGKEDEIRPCLRCWNCLGGPGHHLTCAVNPAICRNERYRKPWPTNDPKKVVIVGGGVAGTEAARDLCERGHKVVLFEKSDKLGGLLHDIDKLPFKDDLASYTDWVVRMTERCGADIRLNTEATPELVMAENPDAIIVAVGSVPATPPIPGIDSKKVVHVLDADSGRVKVKGKIVVAGGGLSGLESALALAMEGNEVKVVDMIPADQFGIDAYPCLRGMLLKLLGDHKVEFIGESILREVNDKGVKIEGKDWGYTELECDYLIDAMGMKPNTAGEVFRDLMPDVYYVGDCDVVDGIMNATLTAYNRALNI